MLDNNFSLSEVVEIEHIIPLPEISLSVEDISQNTLVNKNLNNTANIIDTDIQITGAINYFINFSTVSDIDVVSYLDKYSEIEQIADSVTIFVTDYADFTYFADDYVGTTLYTF